MDPQEDSTQFLRFKRDQYLVDIRKHKNDQFIMAKRMKLSEISPDKSSRASSSTRPSVTNSQTQRQFNDLEQSFCNAINSEDFELMGEIAECIRLSISHEENPPLEEFTNTNITPYITKLLDPQFYTHDKLMVECSWIITNIASGSLQYIDYLLSLDIITKAISLFEHPNIVVKEHAVWILANIAGESGENRDHLLERDIVPRIHRLIRETASQNGSQITLFSHIAWLISNLVAPRKPLLNSERISPLLKPLEYFLFNFDEEEIISYTLWALSYLSNMDNHSEQVFNMNPCDKLVHYVRSTNMQIKVPALRIIGNILTGEDEQVDALLKAGVVGALGSQINNSKKYVRREAYWTISNIMAGNQSQIQEVFQFREGSIIKQLIIASKVEDFEIAKECITCLTNATSGASFQQIFELVNYGLIEILVEALKRSGETKLLKLCLEALDIVLKEFKDHCPLNNFENNEIIERISACGGLLVIEDLQSHADNSVYTMVSKLIENYFDFD